MSLQHKRCKPDTREKIICIILQTARTAAAFHPKGLYPSLDKMLLRIL